jgi:methyl-accepting chemotaxis protein
MKKWLKKVTGAGVLAIAAAVAVITALGTTATLGVANNVNRKITVVENQITKSCELNEGMKGSLDPTVDLNDKAGIVGGYISEILSTMSGMRDGLAAMVETIQKTNGVLSGVGGHTENLTRALDSLIPCISQLADAVQKGNVASAASVGLLDQINELNDAIAGQMSQMRGKLASSATYKIVFTYAMPVLP